MENIQVPADNCPTAPPPQTTVYTRVLHRACQVVGGVEALAARLRVPTTSLYRWLEGESEPPVAVFLKAVDLVLPVWTAEDDVFARTLSAARPKKPPD
jgi:hypothetical protein